MTRTVYGYVNIGQFSLKSNVLILRMLPECGPRVIKLNNHSTTVVYNNPVYLVDRINAYVKRHTKLTLRTFADSEASDQPAHPFRQI